MTPEQALHKVWQKACDALDAKDAEEKQAKCKEIQTLAGRYLEIEWTTDEQDKAECAQKDQECATVSMG